LLLLAEVLADRDTTGVTAAWSMDEVGKISADFMPIMLFDGRVNKEMDCFVLIFKGASCSIPSAIMSNSSAGGIASKCSTNLLLGLFAISLTICDVK
jgi:hypothetical protein